MAEHESVVEIDGKDYPIPTPVSFDLDEAEILWDYCNVGIEDIVPDDNDDDSWPSVVRIIKNPAFRRTLLHVAYRRGNPDATREHIQAVVGKTSNIQSLHAWLKQMVGDDDSPPSEGSTSKPSEHLSSDDSWKNGSEDSSSMSSGNGSSTDSSEQGSRPAHIGVTR